MTLRRGFDIVVVGTSLGGLSALTTILGGLPRGFSVPVVIVQHRAAFAEDVGLAAALQRPCALEVREVEDKDPLVAGRVYLAPQDYHVLVDEGRLTLSTDPRVQYARPSIDVLFESAADTYRDRVLGVVLTGANHDGVQGARQVKRRGGYLIVQSPTSAESKVLPTATLAEVTPDRVVALADIARALVSCSVAPPR